MKRIILILSILLSAFAAGAQPWQQRQGSHHHHQHHQSSHHHGSFQPGPGYAGRAGRTAVNCTMDMQQLWNGNHVRLKNNMVQVCNWEGDKIVQGNEVVLLPTGRYFVRSGENWRAYDATGDRIMGVGSNDYIEELPNGFFLYKRNDRFVVANPSGDRIFNVWGDEVVLMNGNLFRCYRNGRYYYFDLEGNERK